MTDPIRGTCDHCGELYFVTSQSGECPHEYTTGFTKGLVQALLDRLSKDSSNDEQ